ncbi:MAG: DUF4364 family protein [Oscillospiraceae bacterium]|nr:DUF4364 family protein [Oscillospiraceae bacterium]
MKKNMLDENLRKISEKADRVVTDPTIAGVLLCYMLYRVKEPIDSELLYDIAVTGGIINYFAYQDALQTLRSSGSIAVSVNECGETIYALTTDGIIYANRLKNVAAKSYRDHIITAAKKALARHRNRKDVRITYEPHVNGCHLHVTLHDGVLTLLELKLYAPDQEQAEQLGEQILSNPSALYHDVIQAVMRRDDPTLDLSDN